MKILMENVKNKIVLGASTRCEETEVTFFTFAFVLRSFLSKNVGLLSSSTFRSSRCCIVRETIFSADMAGSYDDHFTYI